MFARSLNMPAHCGMEPFRQSWHFHLKSCKLVLPERSCGHRGEHQSNNFWKLLTGPPFAGDVPLQALVFSNSLSMHQTLYHHSLSTFSPFFLPAPPRNRHKPFQIALPKVRTTRYQHSFFFHTALLWNSLPQSIQATKPPQQFRIALEQLWHKYKHNPTTDYHYHCRLPQIYHSEFINSTRRSPDQSVSALLGNPLYIE